MDLYGNQPKLGVIYTCFPGGRHKALTMSYDDGREEDRRLVRLFNRYGIKGTFNINAGLKQEGRRIPLEEMRELYKGHEVACHTFQHPTIARCPIDQTVWQSLWDRRLLEEHLGYPVRGLAYPNGSYDEEICRLLPSLGIRYGRTVGSTDKFEIPSDFTRWTATCHHNHRLLELGEEFAALYKRQYLYLMYVWGHSYEFTDRNNWELMETFCERMGGREDIWYATNIQIADYLEAARRVFFDVDGTMAVNPNACSIWFDIDGRITEVKGGETLRW